MSYPKSGLRAEYHLRPYQKDYSNRIVEELSKNPNFFLSLPQGTGKTIIALHALCELFNNSKISNILVLLPRRVLVKQWVDKADKMFYGLHLIKNPTLSIEKISKIKGWLKYSGAIGIAMTAQSFKNYVRKGYFTEKSFDLIVVDEAADLVVARDYIEGFRMSAYLTGLEKWCTPKMFLFPFQVDEKKLDDMIMKFGKEQTILLRDATIDSGIEELNYIVKEPAIIEDLLVDNFVTILNEERRKTRFIAITILDKHNVKGYKENLETLITPRAISRLKNKYKLSDELIKQIQMAITKYILVRHVMRWFLYSNRKELSRSILASQKDVEKWLSQEDKKLAKLAEIVKDYLERKEKIYIFSQYIATAELIRDYLKSKIAFDADDMVLVTGMDEDEQYNKLDDFKKKGKILISTPVFDKGTDIPEADAVIVYTPPMNKEKLHQVVGRIRGGDIVFLAYAGFESEIIERTVATLRKDLGNKNG